MRRDHDEEVWRACLAEPHWQKLMRENDCHVIRNLLQDWEQEHRAEQAFHRKLTAQDLNLLRQMRVRCLEGK